MTIVEELRTNRESGAKRLEAEYKAGLMTLARRFCTDEGDAEELVNRTFAAVVEGIDDYLEQSAFFGWMCQILSNIHAKDIRKKSHGIVVYPGVVPDVIDEDAEDRIFQEIDASLLHDAIENLPKEMQEAIVLHYFTGLSVQKIAKFLAIPEGTVKSRLHYARLALGAKLGANMKKPGGKAVLLALLLCGITALGAAVWNIAASSGEAQTPADASTSHVASRMSSSEAEASGQATSDMQQAEASNLSTSQPFNFSTDFSGEQNMNISRTTRAAAMLAAATVATSAIGAEVQFKDSSGDHNLANAANWSSSTWGAGDTLLISSDNFTFPSEATPQDTLHLSTDMPAPSDTIRFLKFPRDNVTVDFGGRNLKTKNLVYICSATARPGHLLNASGGFSGVNYIALTNNFGKIRFTNGVFWVENGVLMDRYYTEIHVCKGAELVVENIVKDAGVGMLFDNSHSEKFLVDGGKFVINEHNNETYRRTQWRSRNSLSEVSIVNGGEYRDDSNYPANAFLEVNLTIKDSGYFETNSTSVSSGNLIFLGSGMRREITNSIFRVAQLYCGPISGKDGYQTSYNGAMSGSTVDFCDSEETFAFAPGSSRTTAGIVVPSAAANNTIRFRGEENRFASQTFLLGGSNSVEVTGGSFSVSNSFEFLSATAGSGSRLLIRDADAYIGAISSGAASTNALVEISGAARVAGGGNFEFNGPGSTIRASESSIVDFGRNTIRLAGDGSELLFSGIASTGSVAFAASNCTMTFAATTNQAMLGTGWTHINPFWFKPGQSNNVLVLSNATFRCGTYAYYKKINQGYEEEAVPYTNCPNCAIEFRGPDARLVLETGKESENGNTWFCGAFGETIDHEKNRYTADPYALDNPVRLRFVLPPSSKVYAEAPVQALAQILVLGGNAEFEFDMSEYDWPAGEVAYPLVFNELGFSSPSKGSMSYINVDQLNETNALRMPVDRYGKKAGKFVLSPDGKTLYLVVKKTDATTIVFR